MKKKKKNKTYFIFGKKNHKLFMYVCVCWMLGHFAKAYFLFYFISYLLPKCLFYIKAINNRNIHSEHCYFLIVKNDLYILMIYNDIFRAANVYAFFNEINMNLTRKCIKYYAS